MKSQFKNQIINGGNLTLTQFKVLYIINKLKICNMSQLSEMMEVSKGTMTTMLNKLVEDGYVVRSNSSKDRRTVFVELSEMGQDEVAILQEKLLMSVMNATEKLAVKEQREAYSVMEKLYEIFKDKTKK
nr:MarR family transcriptional regulator [Alkaliphilus hydrothermalis]